jgi:integrase/recombinase XerD
MAADIYGSEGIMQQEEVRLEQATIPAEDKQLISDFVNYKTAADGIKYDRMIKYMRILRLIALRYLNGKSFKELDNGDIERVVAAIERSKLQEWSKHDYKLILRMFLTWLKKDVAWIKVREPRNDLQAEDMLTEDDIETLIDTAISLRDKALIAALYEGGLRIGELCSLHIKDVSFDHYGAVAIVRGKTGMRRVRLVSSSPYLSQLIEAHPLREEREAPLWIYAKDNKMMTYPAIRAQLIKIAKRAGIKKRVNPHNFRHSRATYLASKLTESQLEEYLGWVQGSKSPRTYVHLSGRDVDEKILGLHGLTQEEEGTKVKIQQCPFCKTINTVNARVCINCKRPLEVGEVLTQDAEIAKLREELEALKARDEARELYDDKMTRLMKRLLANPEMKGLIRKEIKDV